MPESLIPDYKVDTISKTLSTPIEKPKIIDVPDQKDKTISSIASKSYTVGTTATASSINPYEILRPKRIIVRAKKA